MATINSTDLAEHLSDLMRQVQETGEVVEITEDGKVVARLVPAHVEVDSPGPTHMEAWTELDKVIAQIAPHLAPEIVDSVEIVRDIRREL